MSDVLAQLFVLSAALALWGRGREELEGREETPNYHWLKLTGWAADCPHRSTLLCGSAALGRITRTLSGALCAIYGPESCSLIRTQKIKYFWGYI